MGEDPVKNILDINPTRQALQRSHSETRILTRQLGRISQLVPTPRQGLQGSLNRAPMTDPAQGGHFPRRQPITDDLLDPGLKSFDAVAR
ncbi:MAG: hypothetical protein ACJA0K_002225, partial [Maricaulis maris]